MRLIGCVNTYNDSKLLERSLPALRRVVDVLIVADGAYEGFPRNDIDARSWDDTYSLAQQYADILLIPPRRPDPDTDLRDPWPSEVAKRCAYLIGRRDDYYLVVDADEVVEGDVPRETLAERDDWLVMLKRVGESMVEYPIHRLFRHRDGIRYHGTHHAVHVGDRLIHPDGLQAEAPDSVFPRLRLAHLWNQRDADRAERKARYYQDVLVPSETEFRAAHGLGLKQETPRRSKAGV